MDNMPAYFGLDIGSSSIKLLEVNGDKAVSVGIVANPVNKSSLDLAPKELSILSETVRTLIKNSGTRKRSVVISIPESQVFTRVMQFPAMSTPELASAIKWELDQVVPYPPDKIEVSWAVMSKPKKRGVGGKMQVLVVATPKNVSESYVNFLATVGLEPLRVENEVLSLARGLIDHKKRQGTTMVIDIGSSATKLVVGGLGQIYASHVVPIASLAITRMIAETFKLPLSQAEEYKRVYGIDPSQLEGKIFKAVSGLVNNLIQEINKLIASFKNTYKGREIDRAVLVGGGAYLRGILPLLVDKLGLSVILGDAFLNLKVPEKSKKLGPIFGVVLGLAMEE